ncbi:hypothetical protein DPMN_080068 [Dreissena polymorpha]|uniref:Uncharacterized protein n=1 Tax=Dreissena polymorpha TaxID=45954 RepID=A0A9D3YUA9_DREPO|nr:hypothetical protein DPMN_080068 [Dreissena polymorpha]
MNNRLESEDTGARPKTKSTSTNTKYNEEHDEQGLLPSEADDEQTGKKIVMHWDDGSFDRFHPLRASSSEPVFKSSQFYAQRKHLPRHETAKKNVAETPI